MARTSAADLSHSLKGIGFPADKEDLLKQSQGHAPPAYGWSNIWGRFLCLFFWKMIEFFQAIAVKAY